MAVPPPEEQRTIVRFLDEETVKIDTLIDKKRRLVSLVEERHRSAGEPVATGADLGVSSIGGLTQSPRRRLRDVVKLIQCGPFGSQLHFDDYIVAGIPVVNPQNIASGHIRPSEGMAIDDETGKRLKRHALLVGDVVIARRGEMGRCAVVTERESGWLCGTGSMMIRPRADVLLPGFLHLLLSSRLSRAWLLAEAVGTTMANLSASIVGRLPVLVPPIPEQRAIVETVDSERARSASLIEAVMKTIDRLSEYRAALITSAVTGQIDVRGVA